MSCPPRPAVLTVAWTRRVAGGLAAGALLVGCSERHATAAAPNPAPATAVTAAPQPPAASFPTYGYEVVNAWPHDPGAFTEGLVYWKGIFLESTGLNGRSTLRKVDVETGHVREQVSLSPAFFGEGIAVLDGRVYQLTWKNGQGFIYDLDTFQRTGEFTYQGEGWGLTTDGHSLILSNGSNQLLFLDPKTFAVTRTIAVLDASSQPLQKLNELEFVDGEIYANVWETPYVARIDPANGRLLGVIDFTGLLPEAERTPQTDVLNGIAYDASSRRLFVTGKNWPKLYEVKLVRR